MKAKTRVPKKIGKATKATKKPGKATKAVTGKKSGEAAKKSGKATKAVRKLERAGRKVRVVRVPATWSSGLSGNVGEYRVAAELLRAGFNVAKPYWDIDGWDLVVFVAVHQLLVPLPLQVKSVQQSAGESGKPTASREVQGLYKKYVEAGVGVAIYAPDKDKIWLFLSENEVKEAFVAVERRKLTFESINSEDELPLRVPEDSQAFDGKWCVSAGNVQLSQRLIRRAEVEIEQTRLVAQLAIGLGSTGGPDQSQ